MLASNYSYHYDRYQTPSTIQFGQQRRWAVLLDRDNVLIHDFAMRITGLYGCIELMRKDYFKLQVVRHQYLYLQYVSIFLSLFLGSSDLSDGSRGSRMKIALQVTDLVLDPVPDVLTISFHRIIITNSFSYILHPGDYTSS